MTRDEQLAYIEAARERLLTWARERGIPLHRIVYAVPLVDTNFGLSAWFFYETDEQSRGAAAMGWSDRLAAQMAEVIRDLGYAAEWLPKVDAYFDSHENVVRNYEGSYFYRLR